MDDPFMQMHRQMQQMQQAMMSGFPMMPGFPEPHRAAPQRQGSQYRSAAPHVEEVHDDEPADNGTQHCAIVEEPDDPPQQNRGYRERESRRSARPQHSQPQMQPFQDPFEGFSPSLGGFGGLGALMSMPAPGTGSTGSSSYSYSSYTSSGGPGGVTYQETKTHRVGPGGVRESKHTVRDGRTGEERMRLERGLGDRKRTLEQARRHGRDVQRDIHLHGFQRLEDAEHFDGEWQRAAASMLGPQAHSRSRRHATPQLEYAPAQHRDGRGAYGGSRHQQQPRYCGSGHERGPWDA